MYDIIRRTKPGILSVYHNPDRKADITRMYLSCVIFNDHNGGFHTELMRNNRTIIWHTIQSLTTFCTSDSVSGNRSLLIAETAAIRDCCNFILVHKIPIIVVTYYEINIHSEINTFSNVEFKKSKRNETHRMVNWSKVQLQQINDKVKAFSNMSDNCYTCTHMHTIKPIDTLKILLFVTLPFCLKENLSALWDMCDLNAQQPILPLSGSTQNPTDPCWHICA